MTKTSSNPYRTSSIVLVSIYLLASVSMNVANEESIRTFAVAAALYFILSSFDYIFLAIASLSFSAFSIILQVSQPIVKLVSYRGFQGILSDIPLTIGTIGLILGAIAIPLLVFLSSKFVSSVHNDTCLFTERVVVLIMPWCIYLLIVGVIPLFTATDLFPSLSLFALIFCTFVVCPPTFSINYSKSFEYVKVQTIYHDINVFIVVIVSLVFETSSIISRYKATEDTLITTLQSATLAIGVIFYVLLCIDNNFGLFGRMFGGAKSGESDVDNADDEVQVGEEAESSGNVDEKRIESFSGSSDSSAKKSSNISVSFFFYPLTFVLTTLIFVTHTLSVGLELSFTDPGEYYVLSAPVWVKLFIVIIGYALSLILTTFLWLRIRISAPILFLSCLGICLMMIVLGGLTPPLLLIPLFLVLGFDKVHFLPLLFVLLHSALFAILDTPWWLDIPLIGDATRILTLLCVVLCGLWLWVAEEREQRKHEEEKRREEDEKRRKEGMSSASMVTDDAYATLGTTPSGNTDIQSEMKRESAFGEQPDDDGKYLGREGGEEDSDRMKMKRKQHEEAKHSKHKKQPIVHLDADDKPLLHTQTATHMFTTTLMDDLVGRQREGDKEGGLFGIDDKDHSESDDTHATSSGNPSSFYGLFLQCFAHPTTLTLMFFIVLIIPLLLFPPLSSSQTEYVILIIASTVSLFSILEQANISPLLAVIIQSLYIFLFLSSFIGFEKQSSGRISVSAVGIVIVGLVAFVSSLPSLIAWIEEQLMQEFDIRFFGKKQLLADNEKKLQPQNIKDGVKSDGMKMEGTRMNSDEGAGIDLNDAQAKEEQEEWVRQKSVFSLPVLFMCILAMCFLASLIPSCRISISFIVSILISNIPIIDVKSSLFLGGFGTNFFNFIAITLLLWGLVGVWICSILGDVGERKKMRQKRLRVVGSSGEEQEWKREIIDRDMGKWRILFLTCIVTCFTMILVLTPTPSSLSLSQFITLSLILVVGISLSLVGSMASSKNRFIIIACLGLFSLAIVMLAQMAIIDLIFLILFSFCLLFTKVSTTAIVFIVLSALMLWIQGISYNSTAVNMSIVVSSMFKPSGIIEGMAVAMTIVGGIMRQRIVKYRHNIAQGREEEVQVSEDEAHEKDLLPFLNNHPSLLEDKHVLLIAISLVAIVQVSLLVRGVDAITIPLTACLILMYTGLGSSSYMFKSPVDHSLFLWSICAAISLTVRNCLEIAIGGISMKMSGDDISTTMIESAIIAKNMFKRDCLVAPIVFLASLSLPLVCDLSVNEGRFAYMIYNSVVIKAIFSILGFLCIPITLVAGYGGIKIQGIMGICGGFAMFWKLTRRSKTPLEVINK
ncbi:hypothetical protein ADUPG1_009184 [Aduncisulcus paluster]|uniref:Uncharacterized protein n=1 Tax=Aduncisulcus paluster TaxID=2918883 RepID=A0ABQ5KVW8_9EUKA|nr:hypothetical protein ADUPG1_009184 [Aduncisulcus paluster]